MEPHMYKKNVSTLGKIKCSQKSCLRVGPLILFTLLLSVFVFADLGKLLASVGFPSLKPFCACLSCAQAAQLAHLRRENFVQRTNLFGLGHQLFTDKKNSATGFTRERLSLLNKQVIKSVHPATVFKLCSSSLSATGGKAEGSEVAASGATAGTLGSHTFVFFVGCKGVSVSAGPSSVIFGFLFRRVVRRSPTPAASSVSPFVSGVADTFSTGFRQPALRPGLCKSATDTS
jgi:hypothetical protein